jgi:uncharacterized protein (TIGR03437 family)
MRLLIGFVSLVLCAQLGAQDVVVVNGASFRTDQPVSPGSWVSAFPATGTQFNGVTSMAAPYPLPKTLNGVTLSVDGVDAPLAFVSSGLINFLIPYSVTPGLRAVVVKTPSATLNGTVRVITTGPGIFITNSQITPPSGAILNNEGSVVNSQQNPVPRGKYISIYATGPGALDKAVEDGAAVPNDGNLIRTKSKPQVFIGGVESPDVQFSGLSAFFAGIWQINAKVPEQPFLSGRVPVQVFMDGVDSNEVAIFVAP